MRYVFLIVFAAVSCDAAIMAQANCSTPWAVFPEGFGFPAGVQVPGTGGSQTATLNGAGAAAVGCSSEFPGGVAVPISASVGVDAGSVSARIPYIDVTCNPVACSGAVDFGGEYAEASISGTLTAITAGSVRPGLLYLNATDHTLCGRLCDLPSVTVAGHTVTGEEPPSGPLPVMLGIPFTIEISGMNGRSYFGHDLAFPGIDAQWRFTELSGARVAVTFLVTPEPSTAPLCAVGFLVAAIGRKYLQSQTFRSGLRTSTGRFGEWRRFI